MSEHEDKTEDEDVEGHKLAAKLAPEPDRNAPKDEPDPDVEGHKFAPKQEP